MITPYQSWSIKGGCDKSCILQNSNIFILLVLSTVINYQEIVVSSTYPLRFQRIHQFVSSKKWSLISPILTYYFVLNTVVLPISKSFWSDIVISSKEAVRMYVRPGTDRMLFDRLERRYGINIWRKDIIIPYIWNVLVLNRYIYTYWYVRNVIQSVFWGTYISSFVIESIYVSMYVFIILWQPTVNNCIRRWIIELHFFSDHLRNNHYYICWIGTRLSLKK